MLKICIFQICLLVGCCLAAIEAQSQTSMVSTSIEAEIFEKDSGSIVVQRAQDQPHNTTANYEAGMMYLNSVHKDKAAFYFQRVLNTDPSYKFNIMYLIGKSYQYGMSFDHAITYYERYKKKLLASEDYQGEGRIPLAMVNRHIYECHNAKEFVANAKDYLIINIGPTINTAEDEYAPVLNLNETQLVFTAKRTADNFNSEKGKDQKPYEDIFIAEKSNGHWKSANNIGKTINTKFNDSNLALSADGKELFVYKDVRKGDIYSATMQEDGSWSTPKSLGESINSSYSENSISITNDGQTLFFASNRPGGIGNTSNYDIYMAHKTKNGRWGKAINLGEMINTAEDDEAPFIDYDGKTLYFSTKGRKGMGGFDIFKTVYDSAQKKWTAPENLGYPINTPDDDIHFVSTKDGKRGYYASSRGEGYGGTDIYMVTISEDLDEGLFTDSDKDGIFDNEDKCPHERGTPENNGCPGVEEEEEKKVLATAFDHLEFETGSAVMRRSSYTSLNNLSSLLTEKENWKILIEGHTDNIGTEARNIELSHARAKSVADYLMGQGLATERVFVYSYGSDKPIADNNTAEGRSQNRRVEMTIIVN